MFSADEEGKDYLKILNIWKSYFEINENQKSEYANWLEETISKRVDAIVSNRYRNSYNKAAFLVCILDECLENLKLRNKGETINYYEQKYHRYIAFKKEINSYRV